MLRAALKSLLRPAGRSQQELARRLGLHPSVLSHKLRGAEGYVLTHAEVKAIVKTLAEWQAITKAAW